MSTVLIDGLVADLAAEHASLDAIAAHAGDWDIPTPAAGWTIRHQIAHLTAFDTLAVLALTDPGAFAAEQDQAGTDPEGYGAGVLVPFLAMTREELLTRWRDGRTILLAAFTRADPASRYLWYGPPMGLASMITARLMETWAHGQDVADAVGVTRAPSPRLAHIARIACLAFGFSYLNRGLDVPEQRVRVELDGVDGPWTFGDEDSADVVRGSLQEFCLVLTRRRKIGDTALTVVGPVAGEWMRIGQAYAGPPAAD